MQSHIRLALVVCVIAAPLTLGIETSSAQWLEGDCESLLMVKGAQTGSLFGWLVEAVGDVNGDGATDFATTAPFYSNGYLSSAGKVAVHSGADGSELWKWAGMKTSEVFGFSLDVVGDLNGDGIRDVVAGGPWNTGLPGGRVNILSGADGALIHKVLGGTEFDALGHSVAGGGDFDGDGVNDIAIGASGDDAAGSDAGRVFVYSGVDFSLICDIVPPMAGDKNFGTATAFVGDVSEPPDGADEIAIGVRYNDSSPPGRVQVFSYDAGEASLQYSIENVSFGGAIDDDHLDCGRDYNGDGRPDIYLGEPGMDRATIFSGIDGSLIHKLDGSKGLYGAGRMIDDMNGDDRPDVIIGARSNDDGATNAGQTVVHSGLDGSIIRTMTHTSENMSFGADAAGIGDFNADDVDDFLVGASGDMYSLGRVYIMAGLPGSICPADVTGDGVVDVLDLLAVLSAWGPCPGCVEDINGDDVVDVLDLLLVLGGWS